MSFIHISPKLSTNKGIYPLLWVNQTHQKDKVRAVRNKRIELLSHPWQGRILPLNQFRFILKPSGAPTRTRTQNSGSEDRCDIHFTIGAFNFT